MKLQENKIKNVKINKTFNISPIFKMKPILKLLNNLNFEKINQKNIQAIPGSGTQIMS